MTTTPHIPSTSGKFQKVVVQLQDNNNVDYDDSNKLPCVSTSTA